MSDREHAPSRNAQSSASKPKSQDVESNPKDVTMFGYVLSDHRISSDVVEVSLRTTNRSIAVGMIGVVLGLPGAKVEVTKVFAGGAKARISAPGIDQEIKHHQTVVLQPGGIADTNAASGHFPHGRNSKPYQEALARINAKKVTAD